MLFDLFLQDHPEYDAPFMKFYHALKRCLQIESEDVKEFLSSYQSKILGLMESFGHEGIALCHSCLAYRVEPLVRFVTSIPDFGVEIYQDLKVFADKHPKMIRDDLESFKRVFILFNTFLELEKEEDCRKVLNASYDSIKMCLRH